MPPETPSPPGSSAASTAAAPPSSKPSWIKRIGAALVVLLAVAAVIWGSDRVTLQGERTIYTVECAGGAWDGNRCSGHLTTGPRYVFRASPRRQEVFYWIRGSQAPSGKFSDCTVKNRDNWSCNAEASQPPALTYELSDGRPTRGTSGLAMTFHSVPKWKWYAIDAGLGGMFSEALD